MKILCVEDGSVDIEGLEEEPLQDGKILLYRQGTKPPFVLEISDNKCNESEIRADERRKVCKFVRDCIFTYGRYDGGRIDLDGIDIFDELDKIEKGESK